MSSVIKLLFFHAAKKAFKERNQRFFTILIKRRCSILALYQEWGKTSIISILFCALSPSITTLIAHEQS